MLDNIYLSLYEKALPDTLSLRDKAALLRKAGYGGLELSIDETDARMARVLDTDVRRDTLVQLRQAGVPVRTICLSGQRKFPFGSRSETVRRRSLELVQKTVDFAYDAGVRVIQIPGYDVWYEPSGEDTRQYFVQGLEQAVHYAAAAGVTLGFETMENDFMNTCRKALDVVRRIDSPYLQIYPDVGNITNGTDDPLADIACARGHIAAAHLKDTVPGVFRNLEFGAGRVDFVGCIAQLLAQGVRLFNCEFWHDGTTDPQVLITRNFEYITHCFERAGEGL